MNESRQSISERLERFEFLLLRLDTYFHKVIEPDVILAIFFDYTAMLNVMLNLIMILLYNNK